MQVSNSDHSSVPRWVVRHLHRLRKISRILFNVCLALCACTVFMSVTSRNGIDFANEGLTAFTFGVVALWGILCSLRGLLIILYVAKYSLGQLMAWLLAMATATTLIVSLPKDYEYMGWLAVLGLALLAGVVIAEQDPTGDGLQPIFVRKRMSELRRARRHAGHQRAVKQPAPHA